MSERALRLSAAMVRRLTEAHDAKERKVNEMRRLVTVMIIAALIVSAAACSSFGASSGFKYKTAKAGKCYTTHFYKDGKCIGKVKTGKRVKVKVVASSKLTAKCLTARKNKYIVVEKISGTCLDGKGNGITSDGGYINYGGVKGHKRGARYTTYAIYANNNSIDDVIIRIDVRK